MKAFTGTPQQETSIPTELLDKARDMRSKMIETIAEMDDSLMEKYLGGQELTNEELLKGLKQAIVDGKIIPILTGSALLTSGINNLLDAICQYMPSPNQRRIEMADDSLIKELDVKGPLSALVFKTTADQYVGKLTFFRVYSSIRTVRNG
jgi:elongation factor G